MKQSQKMRVIVNGIHFYTTKKQILEGVGDLGLLNSAIHGVLKNLERDPKCLGIVMKINNYNIQLDKM